MFSYNFNVNCNVFLITFRNSVFDILNHNAALRKSWKDKFKLDYGLCYSYIVPEYLHVSEIRQVTFHTRSSLDIYLQHPGQYLSWEVYGFPLRLNQEVHVDTYYEVIMILNDNIIIINKKYNFSIHICW